MPEVAYVSRVKVEPVAGKVRRAFLPAEGESVLFGVHGEEPHATTLDYLVAAAGG